MPDGNVTDIKSCSTELQDVQPVCVTSDHHLSAADIGGITLDSLWNSRNIKICYF